jgi:hypothetical protein
MVGTSLESCCFETEMGSRAEKGNRVKARLLVVLAVHDHLPKQREQRRSETFSSSCIPLCREKSLKFAARAATTGRI